MGPEAVVGHQREEFERRRQEFVEACIEFGRRQLGAGFLVDAEELDDLLGALAEGEFVAARQDRYRTGAELLQLGQAGRIFKYIDGDEVDPTDR
jgi:hypothetical protein